MFFRTSRVLGNPGLRRRFAGAAAGAAVVLAASACSPVRSIESADVPEWRATALPSASAIVLEDAGKILNRDPILKAATGVPAGRYTLTVSCDGGGKAFFEVSLDGRRLTEAGAACNGSRETARILIPAAGTVEISTASVDAPLIYAYHLVPAA
ncbi:hypothetical protein QFZ79_002003 [Arthrobacter sp. V4I6]|uniref:hypothetical protein n=1 Tax=unclassified Arthrobacter TaxID=235627 RepID=UPI002789B35E|nr:MULTISPECIES: hypothetical protein [unclassified Arthrobacter]MDQ0819712.1 hypothetical protein [Arthrobacter sp. V1I7]MDQ0853892.1 hypothetical protein [Arthrobacter sp. V4I6]